MNHAEQASNKTDKLAFLADLQVGDTVEVAHRQYQHRIARVEKMTDRLVWTDGQYGPALWWRDSGASAEPNDAGWKLAGLADEQIIRREIIDRLEMVCWKQIGTLELQAIASVLDEEGDTE